MKHTFSSNIVPPPQLLTAAMALAEQFVLQFASTGRVPQTANEATTVTTLHLVDPHTLNLTISTDEREPWELILEAGELPRNGPERQWCDDEPD